MSDTSEYTPAEIFLTRSALGKAIQGNPEAEIALAAAIDDAYQKGRANSTALAEVSRLREYLARIDNLPPGKTLDDAKKLAREGLRE